MGFLVSFYFLGKLCLLSIIVWSLKRFYKAYLQVKLPINIIDYKNTEKLYFAQNFNAKVILPALKIYYSLSKIIHFNKESVDTLVGLRQQKFLISHKTPLNKSKTVQENVRVEKIKIEGTKVLIFTPLNSGTIKVS